MTVEPNGEATFFDLSARVKVRVAGADRVRFLNGQISNDLRKATAQSAIHACVLTAKGKIDADVFIIAEGESFLLDADPEMRERLPARLDRYVIADDVTISEVSDEFALFHIIGTVAPRVEEAVITAKADRFGCAGTDLWLPRKSYESARRALSAELSIWDEEAVEIFRIERGLPRWGHELSGDIIPTEANLEAVAIDYGKGCYIGQEVISRIKMSGQTNKRLCGLAALNNEPLRQDMALFAPDGKEVGRVTSAVRSTRVGKQIGLGFMKRGYQESGQKLEARLGDVVAAVEIVALPFTRKH